MLATIGEVIEAKLNEQIPAGQALVRYRFYKADQNRNTVDATMYHRGHVIHGTRVSFFQWHPVRLSNGHIVGNPSLQPTSRHRVYCQGCGESEMLWHPELQKRRKAGLDRVRQSAEQQARQAGRDDIRDFADGIADQVSQDWGAGLPCVNCGELVRPQRCRPVLWDSGSDKEIAIAKSEDELKLAFGGEHQQIPFFGLYCLYKAGQTDVAWTPRSEMEKSMAAKAMEKGVEIRPYLEAWKGDRVRQNRCPGEPGSIQGAKLIATGGCMTGLVKASDLRLSDEDSLERYGFKLNPGLYRPERIKL
jgi:hypothetical protein